MAQNKKTALQRMRAGRLLLLAACLQISYTSWATENNAAIDLLEAMSRAGDLLEYSGEFVYVSDGKISSMKIMHMPATADMGSRQKLMALDGSMREIIQQEDIVACVLPDQKMGVREKRRARQLFKFNLGPMPDKISRHYLLQNQGQGRVANRNCTRLKIEPKDAYRYGYVLCVDLDTKLLLSSELITPDGKVLESYRFVSISFERVDLSDLDSQTPAKSLNWVDDRPVNSDGLTTDKRVRWRISDNPSGFEQVHYIERVSPVMGADITHLVVSDGLAQVSVFASPLELSANTSGAQFSMGSINSFSHPVAEYMITAVGEVPGSTVRLLAEHVLISQD